jgi:hypothetical protein
LTVWQIRRRSAANTIHPLGKITEQRIAQTLLLPSKYLLLDAIDRLAKALDLLCGFSAAGVLYRLGVNPKEHRHLTEKPSGV